MPPKKLTYEQRVERFWSRVERKTDTECWNWRAGGHEDGYGMMVWTDGKVWRSNRIAYAIVNGDPGKLHVLHQCDNPRCCNPHHLFLGTNKDNVDDRTEKHRGYAATGETNPNSALTDAQVRHLLMDARLGKTNSELSRKYGVSSTQVRRIITGEQRG